MIEVYKIFNATARLAISIALGGALSACFTGVESTPKIGAADFRKQNVTDAPEQHYLDDVVPQTLGNWSPGKKLLVTDDKLAILLGPEAEKGAALKGTELIFTGMQDVVSITGEKVAQLNFTTAYGLPVSYRMDASVQKVSERKSVDIPLTVDLDIVEDVKRKMRGNTYYVMTRDWYNVSNEPMQGRRFVPVKVADVVPGSSFYPVLLVLEDEKGEQFHMYMSVGSDVKSPRGFATLFSLSNPKLRYPSISDDAWKHIINGTVTEDMTRDECRLSLGAPDNIDRRAGYSVLREVWSYENGRYLIFEDGLLRSYRQ